MLLKADKPQITKAVTEFVKRQTNELGTTENIEMQVIDGGSLLHKVSWEKNITYREIAMKYVRYVCQNFKSGKIVSDGYPREPTIKDNTHKRCAGLTISPKIDFLPDMTFQGKKDIFLRNPANKEAIIELISAELQKSGYETFQAADDADYDIVRIAIESSVDYCTTVIGEDTDLLILLLYHADVNSKPLYFQSSKRAGNKIIHDIISYKKILGNDIYSNLLFLHAFTGCDSTSSTYEIGKASAFKKLLSNLEFKAIACSFTLDNQSNDDINLLGKKAMSILYSNSTNQSLNSLRQKRLIEKICVAKSFVKPESLPPTESATKYHSYRTYYQIMQWKHGICSLFPTSWCWIEASGEFAPALTEFAAAPLSLLNIIRCQCNTDCSTRRCGCLKNNIPCSVACGVCQENNCTNVEKTGLSEEMEIEDDEL